MTRRELYSPTDTDVLDALRFRERTKGSATTSWVEITLARIKGPGSPISAGCVLRHLKGLVERGLVAEVAAGTWCTTERHATLIAEREAEQAERAERRKVLRAALGALEAHGVQGRIDSPSGVSVPLDGLQRLLEDAGWEAVRMEGDEMGEAMAAMSEHARAPVAVAETDAVAGTVTETEVAS